jgi:hypothetical protein
MRWENWDGFTMSVDRDGWESWGAERGPAYGVAGANREDRGASG